MAAGDMFELDEVEVRGVRLKVFKYGEVVGAFLRLHDNASVDADGIRDWVRARLAAFKVPAVVDIRDETLPRNASGKVLKRELRDLYAKP